MKSMFYPDMELKNPMSYRGYNYPAPNNNVMPGFDNNMGMTAPQGQPDLSPMPTYAPENVNPSMGQIPDSMPNTGLSQYTGNGFVDGYARGGMVRDNSYGEMSHINPLEAALLESLYGHSTVPDTGLPHYKGGGLFGNPGKYLTANALPMIAALAGNMILPGLGGVAGGALGGAVNSGLRGRKDYLQAGLRGGAMGAMIPSLASGAGSVLKSPSLSSYGEKNAILPSIDKMFGTSLGGGSAAASAAGSAAGGGGMSSLSTNYLPLANAGLSASTGNAANVLPAAATSSGASNIPNANDDFLGSLMGKGKNFLSEPSNLLSLAAVAAPMLYREKQKSPEQLGAEEKRRYLAANTLSPEEIARKEASDLGQAQAARRVSRNRFLPEERLGNLQGMYSRSSTPEEAARSGRWVNYYDNPELQGAVIPYKEGGMTGYEEFEEDFMPMTGNDVIYFKGSDGGQDDTRRVKIPEGGYVANASVVSGLGDGNSDAGAKEIEAMVSDGEVYISPKGVKAIGKGKHAKGIQKLDKMSNNVMKHKGGKAKLPAKAKSMKEYMR